MGKRPFLLDRDDYKRVARVLPADPERVALERALRSAHNDYQSILARRGTLRAEIASVTRELARSPEQELTARLAGLTAQQTVWPQMMAESAEAYARALVAWSRHTWRVFQRVGNEAASAINASNAERRRITRQLHRLHHDSDEHAAAEDEMKALRKAEAPHARTYQRAEAGMRAIENNLSHHFPKTTRAEVSHHHIAAWVDRHRHELAAA